MTLTSLKEKRAIVCGSSAGMGKACGIELASLGASVTLLARREAALQEVLEQLDTDSGQIHGYVVADMADLSGFTETIQEFVKANPPVHILINNSGGPDAGLLLGASLGEFQSAFSQHLLCFQVLVQSLLPGMREAGYGRVINIISTSVKEPIEGLGVSNSIRAAVANWAKTLSREVAPFGVTVNNILPGATDTERLRIFFESKAEQVGKSPEEVAKMVMSRIPLGRFAEPGEIASAVAFLSSPAASYITGINLPVDGGRSGCL
jgi:3-oxoacyl-[acyl-carrier protein] reductase